MSVKYSQLTPEFRATIAQARRTARWLERKGRVREARDLDRTTSYWAGLVSGVKLAEGWGEGREVAS